MGLTRSILVVADRDGNPAGLLSVKHPAGADPKHRVLAAVEDYLAAKMPPDRRPPGLDWGRLLGEMDRIAWDEQELFVEPIVDWDVLNPQAAAKTSNPVLQAA